MKLLLQKRTFYWTVVKWIMLLKESNLLRTQQHSSGNKDSWLEWGITACKVKKTEGNSLIEIDWKAEIQQIQFNNVQANFLPQHIQQQFPLRMDDEGFPGCVRKTCRITHLHFIQPQLFFSSKCWAAITFLFIGFSSATEILMQYFMWEIETCSIRC